MKVGRISEIAFTVCFLLFLSAAMIRTALTAWGGEPMYSYYENRMLASRPDLSVRSVLDGSFSDGFDSYVTDRSAGRNTLLKARTAFRLAADVKVLDCPVVNEVVVLDD